MKNLENDVIGLRKKEQYRAVISYIVLALAMLLPYAKCGGKTINGYTAAFSGNGNLYFLLGILALVLVAAGLFLVFRPSVNGVHLWAWIGAAEAAIACMLLFGSKQIFDANGVFPEKFMVADFAVGYWFVLIAAFVGLYYAMAATKTTAGYIVLVILSVIWLFPIAWILITSFRGEGGYYVGYFIPKTFTLDNYRKLFDPNGTIPFAKWWMNTFIVATVSCILNTLIVLATSFILSRTRFTGRETLMKAMMVIGMFPGFMSMIAVYNILKSIGINQSLGALILVNVASAAMGYYICKGTMDTIPKALDEAATIDGATKFQLFYKIIIPMSKPIIIYQLMVSFLGPWGDYIFPSLLLGDKQESYTVALGLKWMTDFRRIEAYYTQFAAGSVLVSVPIVILFISLQRYYVEGMSGAVKG